MVEAKRYEISLESAPQAIIQIYFALTTGILTTTMMIGKYSYNSIKRTCSIKQPDLHFFFQKIFFKRTVLSQNSL